MKNKRLTEDQRQKWLKVMRNDFMSSEEENSPFALYVNKMFQRIDESRGSRNQEQWQMIHLLDLLQQLMCPSGNSDLTYEI